MKLQNVRRRATVSAKKCCLRRIFFPQPWSDTDSDPGERLSLLGSRRLSSTMKHLIQQTPLVEGRVSVRVRLNSRAGVGAFSTPVAMKSKLAAKQLRVTSDE